MSGHLCESRRDSVRHRETGSDNRVARETTYRAPDWHLGGIRDCGNVRSAPCLLYDRFRKVFTSVTAQQIAWSGALRVDEGLGPNKAFSGAISGNHGLRYPYRAEILDTQAVLNDTHVKCPISIGHSLRVVVLNRMRCDRSQSAQHRAFEARACVLQSGRSTNDLGSDSRCAISTRSAHTARHCCSRWLAITTMRVG